MISPAYWNERETPIRTLHSRLERFGEGEFKVHCVRCIGLRGHTDGGLVLIDRDNDAGFCLRREGMCVRCGQRYFFLDDAIAGEPLPAATSTICFFCKHPAHPSTGAQYTETAIVCRYCVVDFWKWFRAQQHKKWSGAYFYDHAAKR